MDKKRLALIGLMICFITFTAFSLHLGSVQAAPLLDGTATPAPSPTPTPTGGSHEQHSSQNGPLPNFWDQVIMGFSQFIITYFIPIFPSHNSPSGMVQIIINTIGLFFRMAWIFAKGNVNLGWVGVLVIYLIVTRIALFFFYAVWFVIRLFRQVRQAFW